MESMETIRRTNKNIMEGEIKEKQELTSALLDSIPDSLVKEKYEDSFEYADESKVILEIEEVEEK